MKWVHDAITRYTGVTEQAEVEAIFDVMCDSVRTFSGLSPNQLCEEARLAHQVAEYLKTDTGAAYLAALESEGGIV